jgi:hypothetical protein
MRKTAKKRKQEQGTNTGVKRQKQEWCHRDIPSRRTRDTVRIGHRTRTSTRQNAKSVKGLSTIALINEKTAKTDVSAVFGARRPYRYEP